MDFEFGNFIVFADESGDHSEHIDPQFPIFVLNLCIFSKQAYFTDVVPEISKLKFKYWGHDLVVLHARDIRKASGDFSFLINPKHREAFFGDLNDLMSQLPFSIIPVVIDKRKLKIPFPQNVYFSALFQSLSLLRSFLSERTQQQTLTHLIFEERGKHEDSELSAYFMKALYNLDFHKHHLHLKMNFASKKMASTGLQIADLTAHPIGRHFLKSDQTNRSYEIIHDKIYTSGPEKRKTPVFTEA